MPEKIQEAREQLSRVAKLEFRLVYPDNGERLRGIDAGTDDDSAGIPDRDLQDRRPSREQTGGRTASAGEEKRRSRRRPRHGVSAYYGNEGWTVQLNFDARRREEVWRYHREDLRHRFAIVLDGVRFNRRPSSASRFTAAAP